MDYDRRPFHAELRILDAEDRADAPPRLEGYAALYDTPYDIGGFTEILARGAFTEAIGRDDVRALLNHDSSYVMGRTASSTLTLGEDEKGLTASVSLPDAQWVRDQVIGPIRRGDNDQMSFGFRVESLDDEQWSEGEGGELVRTIHRVKLYDVSVATFGANPQTSVSVRSANRFEEARRLISVEARMRSLKASML